MVLSDGKKKEGEKGGKGQETRKYKILTVVCAFWQSPELRVKLGCLLQNDTALCEAFFLSTSLTRDVQFAFGTAVLSTISPLPDQETQRG